MPNNSLSFLWEYYVVCGVLPTRETVLISYERITFVKDLIGVQGKPQAEFICPGHPLLNAVIDLILERYRDLMKQGAVLIDKNDPNTDVRALFYLEHSIKDARTKASGEREVVSRRMQFVEMSEKGVAHTAGYAPYLDYEPINEEDRLLINNTLEADWLKTDLESAVVSYAVSELVPEHLKEVRKHKDEFILKAQVAVKDRLTKEITYWDHRAEELKAQEQAGKQPRMNWQKAQQRADELQRRLQKRMEELEQEKRLSPIPPNVIGGALIVPIGLLAKISGYEKPELKAARELLKDTARVELLAMETVMEAERKLGNEPKDVGNCYCY
ncbi:MAG: helicase domain protein [bacterium]|nr:MAG: helicase domain protein [bacterium]